MPSVVVENVCGWIGSAIAMFFYISPIVPLRQLMNGEVALSKIPGILLLMSLLNCVLWCEYGIQLGKYPVWVCNGAGGATTLIWLMIYWIYFAELKLVPSIVYNVIMVNIIAEIFFICYSIAGFEYNQIVGYVAMFFNVLMYAAPGEKLFQVFKTGDHTLIPIVSSIAGTLCSSFWGVYGIILGDINIIIPNALGVTCAILQVVCWIIYYLKNKGKNPSDNFSKIDQPIVRDSNA